MGLGNETSVIGIDADEDTHNFTNGVIKFIPEHADLSGKMFKRINFLNVNLNDSVLRKTRLYASVLAGVELNNTDFSETEWKDVELRSTTAADFLHLNRGKFDDVIIAGNKMDTLRLHHTQGKKARFNGCEFRHVSLDDSDFSESELTLCNFKNVGLNGIDFSESELTGMSIEGCSESIRAIFYQAKLIGCSIMGESAENLSPFRNLSARRAYLTNCRFEKIDLQNSTFDGATFSGECHIIGCDVTNASFERIIVDAENADSALHFKDCVQNGKPFNKVILPEDTIQFREPSEPITEDIIFEEVEIEDQPPPGAKIFPVKENGELVGEMWEIDDNS